MGEFYGAILDQGPDSLDYDPRTGIQRRRPFTGTPDAIDIAAQTLINENAKFSLEAPVNGGYRRIVVFISGEEGHPADQPLTDDWERDSNMIEKDLWELPKVAREMAKFSSPSNVALNGGDRTVGARWKSDIEGVIKGDLITLKDGTEITYQLLMDIANAYGLNLAVMQELFSALGRGSKSKMIPAYVLRRTRQITENATLKPDDANVGKVYTTAQLQVAEPIPFTIKWSMPEGIWLKMAPDVKPIQGTPRWSITQEWWWAEYYDTFVYDPAV